MIRKYWWLAVFAVSVFILDALIIQFIELLTTEIDLCRNMKSVNPLTLVNCADLNSYYGCETSLTCRYHLHNRGFKSRFFNTKQ